SLKELPKLREARMKLSSLALIITIVLFMTLVVTAQLPQGPQKSQPVLSMDFAQYCVGDSWKLKLSNGVPNTFSRLSGISNGQSWEITNWRKTEADGSFTEAGTFAAEAVGSHSLQLSAGETLSNTVSFVVSKCRVEGRRIAFVSTRDGGGP